MEIGNDLATWYIGHFRQRKDNPMCYYRIVAGECDIHDIWTAVLLARSGQFRGVLVECSNRNEYERYRYLMSVHFPDVTARMELIPSSGECETGQMKRYKVMWE